MGESNTEYRKLEIANRIPKSRAAIFVFRIPISGREHQIRCRSSRAFYGNVYGVLPRYEIV